MAPPPPQSYEIGPVMIQVFVSWLPLSTSSPPVPSSPKRLAQLGWWPPLLRLCSGEGVETPENGLFQPGKKNMCFSAKIIVMKWAPVCDQLLFISTTKRMDASCVMQRQTIPPQGPWLLPVGESAVSQNSDPVKLALQALRELGWPGVHHPEDGSVGRGMLGSVHDHGKSVPSLANFLLWLTLRWKRPHALPRAMHQAKACAL